MGSPATVVTSCHHHQPLTPTDSVELLHVNYSRISCGHSCVHTLTATCSPLTLTVPLTTAVDSGQARHDVLRRGGGHGRREHHHRADQSRPRQAHGVPPHPHHPNATRRRFPGTRCRASAVGLSPTATVAVLVQNSIGGSSRTSRVLVYVHVCVCACVGRVLRYLCGKSAR